MKIRFLIATGIGLIAGQSPDAWGSQPPAQPALPNYDKRAATPPPLPDAIEVQAAAQIKARVPRAKIERDNILGVPRLVSAPGGFLSGPNGKGKAVSAAMTDALPAGDPHRAIKAFVNEHAALFGHNAAALAAAKVTRDYVTEHNGLRTVIWQQTLDDIPVFEGVFIGHVTRNGELVSVASRFVPKPDEAAAVGVPNRTAVLANPAISAAQAVVMAARNLGTEVDAKSVVSSESAVGPEKQQRFTAQLLRGEARTQLRWLPTGRNSMRLCWRVELTTRARPELYSVLVDVETGEVLVRRCLTAYIQAASYNVFTSDSPSPFSPGLATPGTFQPPLVPRTLVTFGALNTNASPNGWINDGVTETRGNNVDAHTDKNDDDLPDLPRPNGGAGRVFDFPLGLTNSPSSYSAAAVVNLFYWNNFMHDKLYTLGFTEAAGNFQNNNFGKGGAGNDAVLADAQDGYDLTDPFDIYFHRNNANFSTPPDGLPGRMQMYIFDGPNPNRDGDLDAEVMCHEYTHGLSNRLVGGGVGIYALQAEGMGEGWSDFYALSLLSEPADDVHATYASGGYASFRLDVNYQQNYYFGIRRYPYSTDMSKNPLTFKDIDPTQADLHPGIPISPIMGGGDPSEVHNQGEVWCVTLWEARAALIDKLGYAAGNTLILQLVTDGMKLAPVNPTFLEARDAIILADQIKTGGDNYSELWIAFAKRGMGFSASAPDSDTTGGVVEAFDVPDDVEIGVEDGILEVKITPASGTVLFAPSAQPFFIRVTDGVVVTNAAITATINGTNLVFRNDGVAPDLTTNNAIYSALFNVPTNQTSATLTVVISAPGKNTSTNVATYLIIPIPGNDNFTNAIKVPAYGAAYVSNNKLATTEPDEPAHAGIASASSSLWWSYTPTSNTNVLVDTAGSKFDSIVAVYTNSSLSTLGAVTSANDIGTRKQAYVSFNAKLGTIYRIAVASYSTNSTGTLFLNIALGGSPDTNAPVLTVTSPLSGLTIGTNRVLVSGAAVDSGPAASGISDISIRVNPGGAVETIPGPVNSLVTSSNWSRMVGLNEGLNIIEVTATDVAGNKSAPATLQVTYRPIDPANDLLVNAIVLTTNSGVSSVNSALATKEFGEPNHAGYVGGKSVWWTFPPPVDGVLTLNTTNSSFDTLLGLYTGNQVNALTAIASNDDAYDGAPDGFSRLTVAVRSNQVYHIAVDGFDDASGVVFLHYTFTPAKVYRLTINSTSGGQVTPSSGDVVSNATVVLTATPEQCFEFDSWTGSFPASLNPLAVVVNSNLNLTAHFRPASFSDDFETGNLLKLDWTTGGSSPWFVQSSNFACGAFAVRSGAISDNQTSSLVLTATTTAGNGSFQFKVSSEPSWDFLKFYVDGVLQQQWSGEIGWMSFAFPLSAGTHTLEWRYAKDAFGSSGLDAAFIDNVDLPLHDLALTITDAPDPLYVGGTLVYTIGVTNSGPLTTTGITVTDVLPVGLNYISGSASPGTTVGAVGNLVTANVGSLAPGAGAVITIQTTPSWAGNFVNTADVTANEADSNLANNSAQTSTLVNPANLDDYIAAPDHNYTYQVVGTSVSAGQKTYILDMTSQAWLTTNEVNRTLWKHWLIIVQPTVVTNSKSLLFISGGSNPGTPPTTADSALRQIALDTGSVVTELKMVPNEPLTFAGEGFSRTEDEIIAYTWDKFLRTGDAKWPARLPMTKAAVRAMDTVTSFCATNGGGLTIDKFVVSGGSKRGWTSWTTAAVDPRVAAIIPASIDVLNVGDSFAHHYRCYNYWSPAIQDYVDMDIMGWNGTSQFQALMDIEDPYSYRARYTMPKFEIWAAGDEYFLPDSSQFYFHNLPAVKYMRCIPNTDHSLGGSDAYVTLEGCYQSILFQTQLPQFSWTLQASNTIRVVAPDLPTTVTLWQATNATARDFRLEAIGAVWTSRTLTNQGGGVYLGTVTVPPAGWKAFFVELTYNRSGSLKPLKFTTQVYVVPDILPFDYDYPPPNNQFPNATKVPSGGGLYPSNNRFATIETAAGEPPPAGMTGAAGSLWWAWTPVSSTNVLLDTSGSAIDTVLAVYTGNNLGSLVPVIATNNVGSKQQAYLSFNAQGGTAYRITVASASASSMGSLQLRVAPGGQLDTTLPQVSVSTPVSGITVTSNQISFTGTAADLAPNVTGIRAVFLSVNGATAFSATGTNNWTASVLLQPGDNVIVVTAVDAVGNVSPAVTLHVNYLDVNLPFTPTVLQMVRQLDGSLLLQVLGQTNQPYVIQGATNLTPPIFWQNLSTNIATGGVIQYVDPGTGTNPLRFYRAIGP